MQDAINAMLWVKYLCEIVLTGNYDNSWLYLLPGEMQECIWEVGKWLAGLLGY